MRTSTLLFACGLLTLAACGGGTPAAETAPAPSSSASVTGTIAPATPAQYKLAHFRTPDGMIGLVLDRTGDKPKYQVDGQNDIVELTQKAERESWEHRLQGYFLVDPKGKRAFFLDEGGGITYQPDGDRYSLMYDKTVPALGAPTVTGTYTAPPPKYQATLDRLTAIAVRTKFPTFKPEDAASPARIGDAIAQATADMFVHYASHGQTDWLPHGNLVPDSFSGVSFGGVGYQSDDAWDPKAKGLARYGGKNQGFSHYDTPKGNHMQVLTLQGYPPKLADGTPGLVWDLDGTRATFVTLDGGRYDVDLSKSDTGQTLDAGAGASSGWPPPATDALLTVHDVSSLAKAGAMPQKAADDLMAIDQQWTDCAAKVWAGAQRAIDSNKFTEADSKDFEKKVRTSCASMIQKQEALLVKDVEARLKDRMDLFTKAKARVTQVGADH